MLLPLRTRTEFSCKQGLATVKDLVALAVAEGNTHLAITDFNCFGHVAFEKECKAAGIVPIFGLETRDEADRPLILLAKNAQGLGQIYEAAGLERVRHPMTAFDVTVLHHPLCEFQDGFCMVGPGFVGSNVSGHPEVAVSDPLYLKPGDRALFEVHNSREPFCFGHECLKADKFKMAHLNALDVASYFKPFDIPRAQAVEVHGLFDLRQDCLDGAECLGLKMDEVYTQRLNRELGVIHDKGFEGYFQMVSSLTGWAKEQNIFLGPGRGSAGGSLVAYLLGITEVDPIRFGLLFERFLDPTRSDFPDIDLDFPDDRRDEAFTYLAETYGKDRVSRLGTILRYGGKSALKEGAKALRIEDESLEPVGETIYTPLAGEVKEDCLQDVFNSEAGQELLARHPELAICAKLEGRAKASGKHAAGVAVCPSSNVMTDFAAVVDGVAQIDMHDAEALGIVKLDCLGLRTMAILERACSLLGWSYQRLLDVPLDDQDTLQEFLQQNYAGIFQWEGDTLRGLTSQTPPESFEDLVLLTSIARPGPLQAGMGRDFQRVQKGTYLGAGPIWGSILGNSRGILAYQEHVMSLLYSLDFKDREVGILRKAMSKSKIDVLAEYEAEFMQRGLSKGFNAAQVSKCWNQIKGVGAYLFNRSHAVAYTMVSFWCAYLKHHHPMEFYCAAMDRAPTPEAGAEMLREMTRLKIPFTVIDSERSMDVWTIQDGRIIGALTAMPGWGEAKAKNIIKRRKEGNLTELQIRQMNAGITIYTACFQDPAVLAKVRSMPSVPLCSVEECKAHGGWVLGFIESRFVIDYSSPKMVQKYGACKPGREKSVALTIVDEQDSIKATLTGRSYAAIGERIEAVPDKVWGLFNLSRWEQNGKLYLNDFRGIEC